MCFRIYVSPIHCMYCSHCAPCPKHIDVASVTKFLNLAKDQGGIPETVREHYALLEHMRVSVSSAVPARRDAHLKSPLWRI